MNARCMIPNLSRRCRVLSARCQFVLPWCLTSVLVAHAAGGEELPAKPLSVEDVLGEAATLGCDCVQLPLHHVRNRRVAELEELFRYADSVGVADRKSVV